MRAPVPSVQLAFRRQRSSRPRVGSRHGNLHVLDGELTARGPKGKATNMTNTGSDAPAGLRYSPLAGDAKA